MFMDIFMQQMFHSIILMKNFSLAGLKYSFQTSNVTVHIFYRYKIIHYDSKLNYSVYLNVFENLYNEYAVNKKNSIPCSIYIYFKVSSVD